MSAVSVVVLYVLSAECWILLSAYGVKTFAFFTCFRVWVYSLFVAYTHPKASFSLLMKSISKFSKFSLFFYKKFTFIFSCFFLFYQALMFVELLHNNTKYSTSHKINPSNQVLCFIHWKRIEHSQPFKISISQSFPFPFLISCRFLSFHFSVLNQIWRTLWPVRDNVLIIHIKKR